MIFFNILDIKLIWFKVEKSAKLSSAKKVQKNFILLKRKRKGKVSSSK